MMRGAVVAAVACVLGASGSAFASSAPIITVTGNGQFAAFPAPAEGGSYPATTVPFRGITGMAPDALSSAQIVFADPGDNRVFEQLADGTVSVLAGTGVAGQSGNGGPALDAKLRGPGSIDSFQVGWVIADSQNNCIRVVDWNGLGAPYGIRRDAGTCDNTIEAIMDAPNALDGALGNPVDVAVWPGSTDSSLSYYVADSAYVRQVTGTSPNRPLSTVAGDTNSFTPPADDSSPTSGYLGDVTDISIGADQNTYFIASTDAFRGINRVFEVTGGKIYTVAGLGTGDLGDGNAATAATLSNPTAVLALADGGFLVYDGGHARIRRVEGLPPGGTPKIETIAGNGTPGSSMDGSAADAASIRSYGQLALIPAGLLFSQTDGSTGGLIREIPATAIAGGPSGVVGSSVASFTLDSWDDNALFACKLDNGSFGACPSSYAGLADGPHTFVAQATTNAGALVDAGGASRTWTVDTTPPAAFGLVAPADAAVAAPVTEFSWEQATDATSAVARYELWIDAVKTADTTACCKLTPAKPVGDGTHSWEVRAIDQAGNSRVSTKRSFTVSAPPTAAITIAPSRALVGRTVSFDASASSDSNGTVARYEWDLDGDGSFETDGGAAPTTTRSYDRPQTITISVRVTDSDGLTGVASAPLTISTTAPLGKPLGISINDGAQFTNDPNVRLFASWPPFASDAFVSNDGGFKAGVVFPVAETIAWKLDSSGPERLPKTVYVRYVAGQQTSETYTDDIILDQTPPKLLAAEIASVGSAARAAKRGKAKLRLRATDNVSGVAVVQVTKNKRKPGKEMRFRKTLTVAPTAVRYVRVRDRAGNFSAWRTAKRR